MISSFLPADHWGNGLCWVYWVWCSNQSERRRNLPRLVKFKLPGRINRAVNRHVLDESQWRHLVLIPLQKVALTYWAKANQQLARIRTSTESLSSSMNQIPGSDDPAHSHRGPAHSPVLTGKLGMSWYLKVCLSVAASASRPSPDPQITATLGR